MTLKLQYLWVEVGSITLLFHPCIVCRTQSPLLSTLLSVPKRPASLRCAFLPHTGTVCHQVTSSTASLPATAATAATNASSVIDTIKMPVGANNWRRLNQARGDFCMRERTSQSPDDAGAASGQLGLAWCHLVNQNTEKWCDTVLCASKVPSCIH